MSFLDRNYGIQLRAIADRKRASEERKRKLEHQILDFAKHPENWEAQRERWIVLGMEYFHVRRVSRKAMRLMCINVEDDGVRVESEGERYWLPKLL